MNREAEIIAVCEEAAALAKRAYKLLDVSPAEFRQVLTAKLKPEVRHLVVEALEDSPLVQRVVHNRFLDNIDKAIDRGVDLALKKLEG